MKIDGARILVTGASRGIGEAAALELARRGARLAIAARGKPDLDRVSDEVKAISGTAAVVLPTDVSKEVEVRAMVAATQEALPGMLQRRRGQIVNVGSVASHISTPNLGGYSSTKFALKALSDALRMELQGTGVGVSLICPGPIATEFVVNSKGENEGRLPTRPLGAPAADVARAIVGAITRNQAEVFVPAYYQALVGANSLAPQVLRVAGKRGTDLATRLADRFL